jgi:tryptophan-rich sensory protein
VVNFQRVIALLMATVFVCVFLVPLAFSRHQVKLAIGLLVLYFAYVAFNAYVFVRMRKREREQS